MYLHFSSFHPVHIRLIAEEYAPVLAKSVVMSIPFLEF